MKNKRIVMLVLASLFGALPVTGAIAAHLGIGFNAPGVPGGLSDRGVSVTGCGSSSVTTTSAGGNMFLCSFPIDPTTTQEFTMSYQNTKEKKSVITDGKFSVKVGKIADQSACDGVNGVTFFNNNQGVCAPGYGVYAEVTATYPAPWGRSQWSKNPRDTKGFILAIGGPPAQ